jgi:O-antigen ligase
LIKFKIYTSLLICYLLVSTTNILGFWLPRVRSFERDISQTNPFVLIFTGSILFFGLLLFIKDIVFFKTFFKKHRVLVIYFCFLFLSCFWSDYLLYAIQRYFRVLGFLIFLYLVENRFELNGINFSIHFYIKICVIISLIFIYVLPQYGVMDYEGRLVPKGIFGHKNVLSIFSALSILFLWFKKKDKFILWIILCFFLLFISSGRTAQVALLIVFLLSIFYANFISIQSIGKVFIISFFVSFVLLLLSSLLFVQNPIEEILNLLGKDSSFTGRTDIWPVLLKMAIQKPFIG